MAHHRVFAPVSRLRVGPAIRLEIVDFHLTAGQMIPTDRQVILGPVQLEFGRLGRLAKRSPERE